MTIQFSGAGGLFTRLGHIGGTLAVVNNYQNQVSGEVNNVIADYPTQESLIDGIATSLSSTQTGAGNVMSFLNTLATNTVNTMVYDDNPLSSNTSLSLSLAEVIRQMKANGVTVQVCSVGVSSTTLSGMQGNGVLVSSVTRFDGAKQENIFAENIRISCTSDSTQNSNLSGNEGFTLAGEVAQSNPFSQLWPVGSGARASASAINGSKDNSQGNLLTNSDFETWVSGVASNWITVSGSAFTIRQGSQKYTGTSSLQFSGQTGTPLAIKQLFNNSVSGTAGNPGNLSQFAINGWAKVNSVPVSGVLGISLIDNTGATVNDENGVANKFSLDCTGLLTGGWTNFSGVFRTPYVPVSGMALQFRLDTPLPNGNSLFVDRVAMGSMTQLYAGGPSFAIFSGSDPFYAGDTFVATTTNDRGGASNNKTFQTLCDRLFGMKALGYLLPSSGMPSISDSLIT